MKKIIAVILTVALLSCAFIIPVSATNSEEHDNRLFYQTFLEKYLRGSDEYLLCYEELYYSKNTNDELEWVFIHARIDGGDSDEYYDDEFCGVHVLQTSGYVPFEFGYGVYDVKENKFYDLTEVSYYNKTHDTPKYEYAFDLFKTYYKPEKIGDQNENVFSVVGSSTAIFGKKYDLNDESTVMTFDPDDGLYKYTFTDVQPEKNVTFAVVMNHKWYDVYPVFNEETINIISSGDILVTFDAKTTKIELSGDGIQTAIDVENAIAVGNGSENYLNNENWNPTAEKNSMKEVSEGVWEYTCSNVPAGEDYQIKTCFNSIGNENPYEYNFGAVNDFKVKLGEELTASFNGRPCHFDVAEDGSTVTYKIDISNFNFYTKQGAKFLITVTPPEGNRYEDAFVNWTTSKFGEGWMNNYSYKYNELFTHYDGEQPDWVLCQAKYGDFESPMITWLRLGGIGGRTVIGMSWDNPFATGYGVYDVEANEFYALEDLTDDCFMPKYTGQSADKYEGLTDALAELNIGYATGDANKDNKVDIFDATLIQKVASGKADMDYDDKYIADINADNVVDILDATAIQRYAVSE